MIPPNKIYNLDCIEGMREIEDNSINLVVTSPPYNIGIDYDSYTDKIPFDEYYKWCKDWMSEIFRVLKPDGKFCLNHYISFGNSKERETPLMDLNYIAVNEIGFKHHALVLWMDTHRVKYTAWGSWLSASAPYINCPVEGILILYKDRWRRDEKGESTISKEEFIESCGGIWRIKPETKEITKANFPIELPARWINLLTYKGDLVLDPFMGGGTTALASAKTGRNYIGFDLSEKYCNIAEKRVKNYTEQHKLPLEDI